MLKILKQEFFFIPLMLLLVEFSRRLIQYAYPETALFDRGSELETFIFRVWQITWITSAVWLLMRVVFPPGFRALRNFYSRFDKFADEYKETTALKIFLVFFISLVYLVGRGQNSQDHIRDKLVDTLSTQLYVREATGHNDGVEVERYLKFVGQSKGAAWCSAYVCSNLHYVGIEKPLNPISAWAPVFANKKYLISSNQLIKAHQDKPVRPGDIFTLYDPVHDRVGHVGFVIASKGQYWITNEGNTGLSGTREGSGVHSLKRSKIKIYAIADYITPYLKQHETPSHIAFNSLVLFLSSENNGDPDRPQLGAQRQYLLPQRLYLVQGFDLKSTGIFCADHCAGKTRRSRPGEPAGDHNGKWAIQSQRFDFRWQAYSQLCMQRPGTKGKTSGAPGQRIQGKAEGKAKGKNHFRNKGSPLYTERC